MEFLYVVDNKTSDYVCGLEVRDSIIINAPSRIFKQAMGKDINAFLTQLYVWGNTYEVQIYLVGLRHVLDFLYTIEERFNIPQIKYFNGNEQLGYEVIEYITEDELREKMLEAYRRHNKKFELSNILPVGKLIRDKKKEDKKFVLTL